MRVRFFFKTKYISLKTIFLIIALLSVCFDSSAQIRFITGYENSNVDTAVSVCSYYNNTVCFAPYKNSSNTETVWFNFGVTGFRRDTIITFLMNYHNQFYPPNNPVASFNGRDYFNVKARHHNNTNMFYLAPDADTVYVSTGYPYSYSRLKNVVNSLNSNCVKIDSSQTTLQGHRLYYITFTDRSVKERRKRNVWIVARQHAFESLSSYVAEGMINYLASDEVPVGELLKNYIINIVPMVDIDNVVDGQSGRMSFPRDFNRDWNNPIHHEIAVLERWIKKHSKNYDMFFDIHATYPGGVNADVFSYFDIYGNKGNPELDKFWRRFFFFANYRPKIILDNDNYGGNLSADYYNAMTYKNLKFATTIECDWNLNSRGKVWQISDLFKLGENILKAIPSE